MDLEALIPLILLLLAFVFGGSRRRKTQQRPQENTPEVEAQPDSDTVFPPFMENFEGFPPEEEELAQETVESNDAPVPMTAEEVGTEPETIQEPSPERKPTEPPPVPVDSPTPLPTKPLPATSLIDLSPETFRQGIILSEILGRPKGLRRR